MLSLFSRELQAAITEQARRRGIHQIASSLLLLLGLCGAVPLAAQYPCAPEDILCREPDNAGPTVNIDDPADNSALTLLSPYATVRISTWDDYNLVSLSVAVNGVDQTSSFAVTSSDDYNRTYSGSVPVVNGSNTIYAEVTDDFGLTATHQISFSVTITDRLAPVVTAAPHNGERLDVGICALNCFDAVAAYSTPAYTSLDVPRAVTLLYRSGQAQPAATVTVDATDNSYAAASTMSLRLLDANGAYVTFLNGASEHHFTSASGTSRLTARFDVSGLETGAYDYRAVVTSYWNGADPRSAEVPVRVLVVNEKNSRYGSGWSISGVQALYPKLGEGIALTDGAGSISYFGPLPAGCTGTCAYASPVGDFSTLVRLGTVANGIQYERRYPDSSRIAFAEDGTMRSVTDRFGNASSYGYVTGTRALSTITDPVGRVITFAYDGAGKLATITDPMGRVTRVTINTAGNVTGIKDPALEYPFQSAGYDSQHLLTEWYDKLGKRSAVTYDALIRRVATLSLPAVAIAGNASFVPQIQLAAPELQTTVSGSGAAGTATDPHSRVLAVDPAGTVTDTRAAKTTYYLNRLGQPTKVVDVLNRATTVGYDSGRVTSVRGIDGRETTYGWRGARLTRVSPPGMTIQYAYDGPFPDLPTRVWGGAREEWYAYNSAGCLVRSMAGADTVTAKKSTFECDARGRTTKATDPRGHRTTAFYADTGLQNTDSTWTSVDTAVASYTRRTALTRDAFGRVTAVKDPQNRITRTGYDVLNRVTLGIGTIADSTRLTQGPLGVMQVADAKGQLYRFEKNALGWDTLAVDPIGAAQRFVYDAAGRVVEQRNRRGQVTRFTYDTLGRPATMTLSDGRVTSYGYDPAGLWVAVTNPASSDTIMRSADRLTGREVSVRGGTGYLISSTYAATGQRTDMRFDFYGRKFARDQAMTFYYDSAGIVPKTGLLYGLAQSGFSERRTSLYHDADEQVNRVELPVSTWTQVVEKSYSTLHQLIGERYLDAAGLDSLHGKVYSRDTQGRILDATRPANDSGRNFSYDDAGRLARYGDFTRTERFCVVTQNDGTTCDPTGVIWHSNVDYTYDIVGNRTDSGAVVSTGNRLTQIAGYTYDFDADGNVTRRTGGGVDQYLYWNSINQLDSIWSSNVGMVHFRYDGFGRRIRKQGPTYAWNYHYSGSQLYTDTKDDGAVVHTYKYYPGTDNPASVTDWDKTYHFVMDASGNVRGLINEETGAASNSYSYTPYGQLESISETFVNAVRFKGRYHDTELNLYENRARYYDPVAGRFLSEDPIGLAGGMNPYIFASNDPINFSDPTGLDARCANGGEYYEVLYSFTVDGIDIEVSVPICTLKGVITTGRDGSGGGVTLGGIGGASGGGVGGDIFSGSGGGSGVATQGAPVMGPLPSCRATEFPGTAGKVAIQTNAAGYVSWGVYMNNPLSNAGLWVVKIFVDGKPVDGFKQFYPPHGSLPPSKARSGKTFQFEARHRDLAGIPYYSSPIACIIP